MILNVSSRTDICAFYSKWFINRYKEGFLDVRNPFNKNLVSRIYFEDVDLILFCTKNPLPIIPYLKEIKIPIIFHVTLTSYKKDIEPNVLPKGKIINAIKEISKVLGKDRVVVRYDPIFISEKYNIDYHVHNFEKMCELLDSYVNKIIVSFIDEYKNVKRNYGVLKYRKLSKEDLKVIGENFSKSAKKHNMTVQTCYEENNLVDYGFIKGECLSINEVYKITGKIYKKWAARKCSCAEMVDVGVYNTCNHLCKYCYANFNENSIENNRKYHNPNSSLLIGELSSADVIKIRKK